MTKVQVVNAQSLDGREYKKDQVIDVPPGRARDLLNDGIVRAVSNKPSDKTKEVKNA